MREYVVVLLRQEADARSSILWGTRMACIPFHGVIPECEGCKAFDVVGAGHNLLEDALAKAKHLFRPSQAKVADRNRACF